MRATLSLLILSSCLFGQVTHTVPTITTPTIQSAIDAAANGDTVEVHPGVYLESLDFGGKDVVVRATAGPELTVIDANFNGVVVTATSGEPATAELDGFMIANGAGGLDINSDLTIRNCTITMNTRGGSTTAEGGGLTVLGGTPRIESCRIVGNTATTLTGSARGGGVWVGSGAPVFVDCEISGNVANGSSAQGGGLYLGGVPVLRSCLVAGNACTAGNPHGGGIFVASSVTATNCVLSGNQAVVGSAIRGSGTSSFTNCVVWGHTGATITGTTDVVFTNCVVWQHGTIGGVRFDFCNVEGGWAGAGFFNIDADPLFVDPANGDFHLQPLSPCIDAGTAAAVLFLPQDYEGDPRVVGTAPDLGADEHGGPSPYPGSGEDFILRTTVNGLLPQVPVKDIAVGDQVVLECLSPAGGFVGSTPVIAAQLFLTGVPPSGVLPGFPEVQLDLAAAVVVLDGESVLGPVGLPAGGVGYGPTTVPVLAAGHSVLVQAFAASSSAANGFFATTDAHELRF